MKLGSQILIGLALATAGPAVALGEPECRFSVSRDQTAELSDGCAELVESQVDDSAKARILYQIAYALIDQNGMITALDLLDRAVELDPQYAMARHERGYVRADLGNFLDALKDLDVAAELMPDKAFVFSERGYVRHIAGDFQGSLADYQRAAELGDASPGIKIGQAEQHFWLGQYDEAEAVLDALGADKGNTERATTLRDALARVRAYVPKGDPAELCQIVDLDSKEQAADKFDACTLAIGGEADPRKKADFLTVRATAAVVMTGDYQKMVDDLQIAVNLDPDEGYRHANYGFALMQVQHSWAARNSFDRAMSATFDPPSGVWVAWAGRGQADLNLDNPDAARSDALRSMELEPNISGAFVLGSLAFRAGDLDTARRYWLMEYSLGSRSDDLEERLSSVGVEDPDDALAEILPDE